MGASAGSEDSTPWLVRGSSHCKINRDYFLNKPYGVG